jgi:hypothetical protein
MSINIGHRTSKVLLLLHQDDRPVDDVLLCAHHPFIRQHDNSVYYTVLSITLFENDDGNNNPNQQIARLIRLWMTSQSECACWHGRVNDENMLLMTHWVYRLLTVLVSSGRRDDVVMQKYVRLLFSHNGLLTKPSQPYRHHHRSNPFTTDWKPLSWHDGRAHTAKSSSRTE